MQPPIISVIIPTRGRPALLQRAVRSVLAQTLEAFELIVVIDGPDPATEHLARCIIDPRMRWIVNSEPMGGSEARNIGIRAARGEYVALLDDDDEFLPEKLSIQLALARSSRHRFPVGYCRVIGRAPLADEYWPRRPLGPAEELSEYLFCRTIPWRLTGLIQSDMLFAPRELMLALPFTKGLPMHQDTEWVLRAAQWPGVGFEYSPQALAVIYVDENRPSITRRPQWEFSRAWIRSQLEAGRVTPRAYASFLLWWVSRAAAMDGSWRASVSLLRDAFAHGRPGFGSVLVHVGIWTLPIGLRRVARALLSGFKRRLSHAGEMPATVSLGPPRGAL